MRNKGISSGSSKKYEEWIFDVSSHNKPEKAEQEPLENEDELLQSSFLPGSVLVVDDEVNARNALVEILSDEGYSVQSAKDGVEALELLENDAPDIVLTDIKMPRVDGITLLKRGLSIVPETPFVVMTAFGSVESAVSVMKAGAENYVTKPLNIDALLLTLRRANEKVVLRRTAERLQEEVGRRYSFKKIVGDHPSIQRLHKHVTQVAPAKASVLIEGETGTGKELLAAALHYTSSRADQPFVRVNCAALAENLLESELFGHEKGAFTGAINRRIGKFEQANKGTLFLDEVSEIPANVQVKLLRFLQEREIERVGGEKAISLDLRVVAATNRNLETMIEDGTFRNDLYFRLNVVKLLTPPLRQRRSDIPLLAYYFMRKYSRENNKDVSEIEDEATRHLKLRTWPGNVRELENAIERAVIFASGSTLRLGDFYTSDADLESNQMKSVEGVSVPGMTLDAIERWAIKETLAAVDDSTAEAARILGISQRKIQYRLKEWAAEESSDRG